MDSKDIEEIFKNVLTDESQESQESSVFSVQAQTSHPSSSTTPLVSPSPHPGTCTRATIIFFFLMFKCIYAMFL